jgi:hypothetical protein
MIEDFFGPMNGIRTLTLPRQEAVSQYEKTDILKGGRDGRVEKI